MNAKANLSRDSVKNQEQANSPGQVRSAVDRYAFVNHKGRDGLCAASRRLPNVLRSYHRPRLIAAQNPLLRSVAAYESRVAERHRRRSTPRS